VVLDIPGNEFPHTSKFEWEDLKMNQAVFGRNFQSSDDSGPYKKGMLWKV